MVVYICLSYIDHEGYQIGPVFSEQKDADSWVNFCMRLKDYRKQFLASQKEGEMDIKELERIEKEFEMVQAMYIADSYGYIKRITNKLLARGKELEWKI